MQRIRRLAERRGARGCCAGRSACARSLAVLLAGILCIGAAPAAEPGARAPAELVTLNFSNAEIEGVVKAMSEITGKNFIIDPRVKGAITVFSAKPVPRSVAYDVFLSALRLHNATAIEERGLVKIVPESEAKLHTAPTYGPNEPARAAGDRIETRVFTLQHEPAAQLLPVLRPLVAANNTVTAHSGANALVITDYASNVRRLEKIIEALDQPSGLDVAVIRLRHASAADVAQTVNRVFAAGAASTPAAAGAPAPTEAQSHLQVVPDLRSNSLLVRASDPARLKRLRALVATLDAPTSAGGNIHVVYLKNADAVKLAETLRALHGEAPSPASATRAPAPGAPLAPLAGAPPSAANAQFNTIQADAASNAIIVTAPDAQYNDIRAAIEKLDVRRAQVYVEALVAEVTADKAAELGIQWQSLSSPDGSTRVFGGTNFGTSERNILGIAQNPLGAGSGLNIGVVRGRVTIPGINAEVLNLGLLVRALESDSDANILSTPTLLTLDNEEARIVIGQNVPFITGQYALSGAATTPTPFQTIERRDVGLTLRIRPQISQGGTVRMQLLQEVSSVQSFTNSAGPITNKRAVESTVLLDDGEIIVIGGLIQDSAAGGLEKVPVLGDLPLVGGLFQYRTRSRTKTNLMVFLRPTILRDAHGAQPISADRYDYIIGEQKRLSPPQQPGLPDLGWPSLKLRAAPGLIEDAQ